MKKETLYKIFEAAEREHKNLFHDISKEEFYKKLDSVAQGIEQKDENEAMFELMCLFALFKDAHTGVNIFSRNYPIVLKIIENKVYLINTAEDLKGVLYSELTHINEIPTQEIIKKLEKIICYETEFWLKAMLESKLANKNYLKVAGIIKNDDEVVYTFSDRNKKTDINIANIKNESTTQSKNYEVKRIDGVLYVRYSSCAEDDNYKFEEFYKDIENTAKQGEKVIFDLGDNRGGASMFFSPVVDIVKKKELSGYCLINNNTFSSGSLAVADLYMKGFKLVGEPTGASIDCYGDIPNIKVDNFKFTCCTKFFDLSDIFGYKGAIMPDVPISNTLEDYKSGKNKALEYCVKQIKKEKVI